MNICINFNMISSNIQEPPEAETDSIFVPKLPHCAQSPDLDGVLEVVAMRSKKTFVEIQDMITFGKVTLTGKVIKEIFKDLGLDGVWCYKTSCFMKNKDEMQRGLLEILTGAYVPSIVIRGDIFEQLVKEKREAEYALSLTNR